MTAPELNPAWPHEDAGLFREAVNFTAAETGFAAQLVEKDYFCSVLLRQLAAAAPGLVFKGGTCLAKVHAGFYRLSEDLDFLVPAPVDASRSERRKLAAGIKSAVAGMGKALPGLRVVTALTGANNSTQYSAAFGYSSLLGPREETVKIEVGLCEPLLTPAVLGEARTLLLNPVSGEPMVPAVQLPCLSMEEAMAEKLRAALTRRDVAIRDFYDMDYAVGRLGFDARRPEFLQLVRKKLSMPGNEAVNVSEDRLAALRPQVDGQLKPVLRSRDLAEFDLDRAYALVSDLAAKVRTAV